MEPVEEGRILLYRNKNAFLAECRRRGIKRLMIDADILPSGIVEKTILAEDPWTKDTLILKTYEKTSPSQPS